MLNIDNQLVKVGEGSHERDLEIVAYMATVLSNNPSHNKKAFWPSN